jgi:long-chain acyl-CoA synthetase
VVRQTVADVRGRLAQLLREAPADAEAVEFEGSWWHWGRLRQIVTDVDAALAGHGPAARVGLVLENRPEHVASLLSVLSTGRCLVTLSPLQPPERLTADIAASGVAVLLASGEVIDKLGLDSAAAGSYRLVRLEPEGAVDVVQQLDADDAAPSPGTAVEMLTSGTTGPPKRVRLTDRQVNSAIASAGQLPRSGELLASGVGIVSTPLVHIGGLWGVLAGLHSGRRVVLLPRFTLDSWVDAVERHRPAAAGLVPAAMRSVLDARIDPARLASLQVVLCGTAPCPVDLANAFQDTYGARVLMTYGATEFAGAVAGWTLPLHRQWWDRKAGSTGRAYPGVRLRVVSPEGAELPVGTTGVLEIQTDQATRQDEWAWVRTSDLASIDEDGFLWIHGRSDAAIIRGGFKVHADVVQAVLERHLSVREAAVAGLPDDRLGQVPVAAVELHPGAPVPSATELEELCRAHLTPYEVPAQFVVVDKLPRTPSMKVSRVEFLELFTQRAAGVA